VLFRSSDKGQIYGVAKGADFAPGKWTHYALVMHADRQGFHLYVNGVKRLTSRGVKPEDAFANLTLGSSQFQGGLAWFHVYDYPLTPEEVKRDMNYENPAYEMDTPATPNIRIQNYLAQEFDREDFNGGDYDSLAFSTRNDTKNLETCQDACGTTSRCVAYTFNPNTSKCWLKERIQSRIGNQPEGVQTGRIVKDLSIESDMGGNSKCMDVLGWNENDGAPVKTWNCNGYGNQRVVMDDLNRLKVKHSGKCLEIENGSMSAFAPLVQRECANVEHQKWSLDRAGRIHPNHNPTMCLGIRAEDRERQGADIQQLQCADVPNQKWIVRDAEKTTGRVTFYEHCNYVGARYEFGPGVYVQGKDFPSSALSSVRVPAGRTVIVYKETSGGPVAYFTTDMQCFVGQRFNDGSDINDRVSKIAIE
jgi:hypothetical protein